MAAKHFGLDPYKVKNAGLEDEVSGVLPPHPRPSMYRTLVYAMAEWCEEQEWERLKLLMESNGAKLQF